MKFWQRSVADDDLDLEFRNYSFLDASRPEPDF
jgi:hypothetical protein